MTTVAEAKCAPLMFREAAQRLAGFVRYQVQAITAGGLVVLGRKLWVLACLSAAVLAALAVRLLRPLVTVRIGPLRSERIGHFAGNTEVYLAQREVAGLPARTVDLFYHQRPICNRQLKRMWDRTLPVVDWLRWVDRINRCLPGAQRHVVPIESDRDVDGLLVRTTIHPQFTEAEEEMGQQALRRLSVPAGTPFVCFTSRDSAYLRTVLPEQDWRYHEFRNSSIHTYVPAVEALVQRGYVAIRMGAVVQEALQTTNPRIIDYASNGARSDFLDIYLPARCHFFLAGLSGLEVVPMIFRRPRVLVNFVPLEFVPAWGPQDLFIPKKLWLRETHRFLAFREVLASGIGRFLRIEQYEAAGIEVINNTPEEIEEVVMELEERLRGVWQTTDEDEALQRRFWSLFKPGELNRVFRIRVGAEFLRQHRMLLD